MKKNLLFLISLLIVMTTAAQAQEYYDEDSCFYEGSYTNFYAKIFAGANFLQNTEITENKAKYHTGYVISGSLGYIWPCGLILEAEYAFRRNTIEKIRFFTEGFSKHGHLENSSYMANLFWNLPLSSWGSEFCFQPYFGAGIGYDFQQMRSSNSRIRFTQKWRHFSWQLMAGLAYPIFCNSEIALEYKFHQGGSHFNNHALGVTLNYKL